MAIGLEYICKKFKMQYKDVAKMVGVTPGTFNDWISGRRKIPEKRIDELANLESFRGVSKEYFQKELDEIEKRKIDRIVMESELQYEEIEDTLIDDDGNVIPYMNNVLVGGSIEHIMFNDANIELLESIKRVQNSVNLSSCEDFQDTINLISEYAEIINLFGEILESKKITETRFKKTLKDILYAILIHLNERKGFGKRYRGYEDDKFIKKIIKVFVSEEERLKNEQEKCGWNMEEFDKLFNDDKED